METSKDDLFLQISDHVNHAYQDKLFSTLESQPNGSLNDGDVTVLVMNVLLHVASNMYASIKTLLPDKNIDYEFIKVTLINNLKDSFSNIENIINKQSIQ